MKPIPLHSSKSFPWGRFFVFATVFAVLIYLVWELVLTSRHIGTQEQLQLIIDNCKRTGNIPEVILNQTSEIVNVVCHQR
jgi:hypothetical protein